MLHRCRTKLCVPHLARQLGMHVACVLTASLGVHCKCSKGSTGRSHSIRDSVLCQSAASHQCSEDMYLKWYRYSFVNCCPQASTAHMCAGQCCHHFLMQIGMMIWYDGRYDDTVYSILAVTLETYVWSCRQQVHQSL